jgi:diketogulonate reductase-like aldo/keto reductase
MNIATRAADVTMPPIVYGTAWKKERTRDLVALALRAGFRGIDTACQPKHYNEVGVGEGIVEAFKDGLRRDELYLQTKFTTVSGQDPQRIPYDSNACLSEQVKQSLAVSLQSLRTDYLDCLVLHSPIADAKSATEVWETMESFVDAHQVKQLGISNCYNLAYLAALHRTVRIKPVVVQNRFYADTNYDPEIRKFCRDHGIVYQSFWTLSANPHLLASKELLAMSTAYARTPAQILFRYLHQVGVTPLTGTTSEQHMREDLAIVEFTLSESDVAKVTALLATSP